MTTSTTQRSAIKSEPPVKYRHDYHPPDYTITDIDLDFTLDAENTTVTAVSKIKRQIKENAPLILNGENLVLLSICVDGQPWKKAYAIGKNLSNTGTNFSDFCCFFSCLCCFLLFYF